MHRYDAHGDYLGVAPASADGAFQCPHAMVWDGENILLAAREHNRVVRIDIDGHLIGVLAANLRRPSCLALDGDTIWVGELEASIVQLDHSGRLIRRLGLDAAAPGRPGWPNALDAAGTTIAPDPPADRFNSPHAIAVDSRGTIHVAEWLVGGRHVRISPSA
ncbi:hypothetical protein Lfu02_78470 [Longispora fulva]|uniref:NHL repeat-containing protein n=1 Tax=Longispora fulva TaxID=619741 RepID=A0A8J7GCI1_9ACTN|nr:hypothetical protein [Longispora fulva]MBG6133942.1 hypothetical protein [Longispora fulva]GIG63475.1 hypothetical protein Lfu02_78470 [Longispora fulva]